jgi:hypothetical protein
MIAYYGWPLSETAEGPGCRFATEEEIARHGLRYGDYLRLNGAVERWER